MKKTNFITSLLLIVTLFCTMTPTAFAQSTQDSLDEFREAYRVITEEEQRRIDEITQSPNSSDWLGVFEENLPLDPNVSTYGNCVDCNWFTVSVCAGDATLIGEGYHKGFLGLFETDCYAYYFVSRGAEMCPTCNKVIRIYDGEHLCWEIHKKCFKGNYDICVMDVS